MQSLSSSDLNFVLSRCPRDILKLLKDNAEKLFLAGGFIRSTIAGDKVSDIDMFGMTQPEMLRIAKDLTLDRKGRFFETDNAITVLAPQRFPVQFITRWLFEDPKKLVESFDFTVCQAVIFAEKLSETTEIKDGGKPIIKKNYRFYSLISDGFYADLAARRLVYTHPIRDEAAGGSLMRVIKFVKKGYNIQAPSLAGAISRLIGKLNEKGLDLKKDGSIDEKWAAKIITGLLREVDPLILIDGASEFVDEHEVVAENNP